MSPESIPGPHGWRRWAFAAVPAAGLLELGAHAAQTQAVVPGRDWEAARDYVSQHAKPEDLVAFAPRWADPIGREHFGPAIATIEREARPDESRFPRAFEVSIRGAHVPALRTWRSSAEQHFGGVAVTTLENPAPLPIIDDLVSAVRPDRMRVSAGDRECPFVHMPTQSGGLGFGPAIPGDRFGCPGGAFVGVSVVADLDYVPHRCIYAPPSGGTVRLRFLGVRFGRALSGHHALYVEAEHLKGAPITVTFSVGGSTLGTVVHRDGEGWKQFEFDTGPLSGRQEDLTADITSSGERRLYCFEAATR